MPIGHKNTYSTRPHIPIGWPNSAVICGRESCRKPGLIWLTLEEEYAYDNGERIFELPTRSIKVLVK
ncbi:MAG: hypothetical protein DMG65_18435 [Candidatus Angelobacter sp. Gp1-AA117]|nr:MAG: hypothetical protein DMG65_18435 [Candidatus Angelobacter sp. Gp1-AA117]